MCRLFIQSSKLGQGIGDFLCIFARCEVMRAAEVRCEGDVLEGQYRLTNRLRLRSFVFGAEPTINQLQRVFDEDMDGIIDEAAIAAYEKHGEPLYSRDDRREHRRKYPSPTLWGLLRKTRQLNLDNDEWDEKSDDDDDSDLQ